MKTNGQTGNTLIILLVIVVLVAGGYFGYQYLSKGSLTPATPNQAKPVNLEAGRKLPSAQVKITKGGFIPATIEVKAGQSVTWINEDTVSHQLTSDSKNPQDLLSETEPIEVKEQMSFPFTTPSTIIYMDSQNPNLKGVIIVK